MDCNTEQGGRQSSPSESALKLCTDDIPKLEINIDGVPSTSGSFLAFDTEAVVRYTRNTAVRVLPPSYRTSSKAGGAVESSNETALRWAAVWLRGVWRKCTFRSHFDSSRFLYNVASC